MSFKLLEYNGRLILSKDVENTNRKSKTNVKILTLIDDVFSKVNIFDIYI